MASRFWVGGTGTWDNSSTTHWSATTGGSSGASVPGSSDTVTFDGSSGGGTVTVNTNATISSLTMGAFTGTLDFSINNNDISMATFSNTGTATRTLKMGNGTWTLTGTGTVWNMLTVTGLTFTCNSSTIKLSATTNARRTFTYGNSSQTYNNITIDPNTSGGSVLFNAISGVLTLNGAFTINSNNYVVLPDSLTHVFGSMTINGYPDAPVLLKSSTDDTFGTISISSGNPVIGGLGVRDITFTGGATFLAQNSWNLGHNSGITILPPVAPAPPSLGIGL